MASPIPLPPLVIFCGGQGLRLRSQSDDLPKPLLPVGPRPVLWHVIRYYACFGVRRFILLTGYRGEMIAQAFAPGGSLLPADCAIHCLPTGESSTTGERLRAVASSLRSESVFFATYSDGLADLDLRALFEFHARHGCIATLTAVRPFSPFGMLQITPQGQVTGFAEKPRLEQRINGGFFVFTPAVFDYLRPGEPLEGEPMRALSAAGQLMAYLHDGFWACMDTYKDQQDLTRLWDTSQAPWKIWKE